MATILDPSPRAYTPPRPSTAHHVLAAITDLKRLGLDHLELAEEASRVSGAVAALLAEAKTMPADLGGSASTGEVTDAVIAKL